MYYPYLYGKQKELIAIRQLSKLLSKEQQVQPVVEPVKEADSTLFLTLQECERQECVAWVIVNPRLLDFDGKTIKGRLQWGLDLFAKLDDRQFTRPVLLVEDSLTSGTVKEFAKRFAGETVGLAVLPSSIKLEKVLDLLDDVSLGRIFFKGPSPSTSTLKLLGSSRCVLVEDRFPHQSRNADYSGRHFFTDSHLTYASKGLAGFSDYTILPPSPTDGGGPPGAVAIHLCYIPLNKPVKELWVEHFVSDRTEQAERDDDGKFMEALRKFSKAAKRPESSFGLTDAAKKYLHCYTHNDPPSLGTNKQLEVMHHLELVSGVLSGRF